MSSSGDLQSTDDGSGHDTAVFPVDLDDEGETPSGAAEAEMWAEELPNDSALLVVKRGRNAGAPFLLNQPITIAGRLPGSDIFLDDVTVSRRHVELRWEKDDSASLTLVASTDLRQPGTGGIGGAGQRRRSATRQVSPDVFDHVQEPRWRGWPPSSRC